MAIDVDVIAAQMSGAALPFLKSAGPAIGSYVAAACRRIALAIAEIESGQLTGDISAEDAKDLLDMQIQSERSVLAAASGLEDLAVETAINAALGAVKSVVNGALRFPLI